MSLQCKLIEGVTALRFDGDSPFTFPAGVWYEVVDSYVEKDGVWLVLRYNCLDKNYFAQVPLQKVIPSLV